MEKIKLTYGDGFTGRHYTLTYGRKYHDLIGITGGSPEDIAPAKQKAKEILKNVYGVQDTTIIDSLEFEWNGIM